MGLRLSGRTAPSWLSDRSGYADLRDLAIAVLAVGVDITLFTTLSDASNQVGWAGRGAPVWLIVGSGLLAIPVLAYRRRAPTTVCLVLAAHAILLTTMLGSRPLASLLLALYTAAVHSSRGRAFLSLLAVLAAHGMADAYEASFRGSTAFSVAAVGSVFLLLDIAVWAAGRWGASASARSRARELEESRVQLAAEAVARERLHIARELHDIVAHAVTAMLLQAAGARRTASAAPDRTADALAAIETLGVQAISELRRLLTVLRVEQIVSVGLSSPAGISQIGAIVGSLRAGGCTIEVTTTGPEGILDPSVDQTAHRVVQETLTNAAKHGVLGSSVSLTLTWTSDELQIEVRNTVATLRPDQPTPLTSGFGLIGLRERVHLVGGRLSTRLEDAETYVVEASLPVRLEPTGPDAVAIAPASETLA